MPDPTTAGPLHAAWEPFAATTFAGKDISPETYHEARRVFYAGAFTVFSLLGQDRDAQDFTMFQALAGELTQWVNDVYHAMPPS